MRAWLYGGPRHLIPLTLSVCGLEMALSHVGGDFLVVRNASQAIQGGQGADLRISIDGVVTRKRILLPHCIPAGQFQRVAFI